jgi:hypothetical protein
MSKKLLWLLLLTGCSFAATGERAGVLHVGAQNLKCQRSELDSVLTRESTKTREYYVACDFMFTRVLCSDKGCRPGRPQPPCFGGGCFKENAETFEWELDPVANYDVRHVDAR